MNTIRMKQVSKHITSLCFSLALMMASSVALAVPPQTISYQAYLKDNVGLPVNDTENVTFRLYTVETGGTDIWTDNLSVIITDGLFSVELGTVANPLPKSSMDNPLWLGVEINSDGEATPRKALNSVNNAFHAESVEVPLNLTGSLSNTMKVTNSSTSTSATGVHGLISSTTPGGWSAAVRGENKGTSFSGIGVHGSQDGSGWGVYGTAASGRGVYGQSTSGTAVYGLSTSGTAAHFSSSSGYGLIVQSGNVGVGTVTPGSKLTVAGTVQSTTGGFKFPDGTTQTTASSGGSGDVTGIIVGQGLAGGGVSGDIAVAVATGGITNSLIASGAITSSKIGSGAVSATALATNSVTLSAMASNAIGSNEIINESITASDIAIGAVGLAELANNAVNTSELVDGAVTAVKINPAGLNADLVDGLHANEIIDAAADEVRTPISSLPFTISASGSYYVTDHLTSSTGGLDITTNNVTVDLMGFTLSGNFMAPDYGIDLSGTDNVTIKNGTVTWFGKTGIYQSSATDGGTRIINVTVRSNGILGSLDNASGIHLNGDHNLVTQCLVGQNYYNGISVNDNSIVTDNIVYDNQRDGIVSGIATVISGNTVYKNEYWAIYSGSASTVENNATYDNNNAQSVSAGGIAIYKGYASGNTVESTYYRGIQATSNGSAVHNNRVANIWQISSASSCYHQNADTNAWIGNSAYNCATSLGGVAVSASRLINNIGF